VAGCLPYLSWSPNVLSRLAAALILPGELLRRLLLSGAARLAETRGTEQTKAFAQSTGR